MAPQACPNSKVGAAALLALHDRTIDELEGVVVSLDLDIAMRKVVTVVPMLVLNIAYRRLIRPARRWATPWLEPKVEAKKRRGRPSIGRRWPSRYGDDRQEISGLE